MGYIVPCKDMLPHSILSILTNGYLSKDEKPDYRYPDGVIVGGCHRYQKTRDVNSNPTVPHTCYRVPKNWMVSLLYPMLVDTLCSGVTRGDPQNAEWGSIHRCDPVATHTVSVPVWQMDAQNSLPGYAHPGSEHTYYGGYTCNGITDEPDIGRHFQRHRPVGHDMGYIVVYNDALPNFTLSILTNGYVSNDEKHDYRYPQCDTLSGCHWYQTTPRVNSNPTIPHTHVGAILVWVLAR